MINLTYMWLVSITIIHKGLFSDIKGVLVC